MLYMLSKEKTSEVGVRKAQVQGEVKKEEYDPDVK